MFAKGTPRRVINHTILIKCHLRQIQVRWAVSKSMWVLARIGLPAAARKMAEGEALLTKTRFHIAGTLAAVLVLFLCTGTGAAKAEGVPQHLASMAKALYAGIKDDLNEGGRGGHRKAF